MDTFVTITISDPLSAEARREIMDRVMTRMKALERKFNYYSAESELTLINNLRKGDKLILSPEMFAVLERAREVQGMTRGYFDITMGKNNWTLDKIKKTVSFNKQGINLDLGGIAKGFIVDEGIAILKKLGVKRALINAGGDMYCLGNGPRGDGWKVGVRDPEDPKEVIEVLRVFDKGVATSGGYERFEREDGRIVSHIVNPKTKKPVHDIFKSVTVLANDCMTADALATALYAMDPREAVLQAEQIDEVDCIIIDRKGLIFFSSGIPDHA